MVLASGGNGAFFQLIRLIIIGISVMVISSGCGGGGGSGDTSNDDGNTDPPVQAIGKLSLGEDVAVTTKSIVTGGGVVSVNDANSPLNGFTITIPSGSYETSKEFKVSYRPVNDHDLGSKFNTLTPLIKVENGGDFSDEVMTVSIPAKIPKGDFAMAFFYDEKTGTFEGMPFISHDETSVNVATRHFSQFLVASISEDQLFNQMPIESGFLPGKDDWQFANRGSWIAPSGHCAGQSIAALWYYTDKYMNGSPRLFGAYDNNGKVKTSDIWQDDSYGYRFCSVIQNDIKWGELGEKTDKIFKEFGTDTQKFNQEQVWKAFAYAILITKEPQFLGMYTDYNSNGKRGGHAMIIYGVKETADAYQLQVADPNYPGQFRGITFDVNGEPSPYSSAANAAAAASGYGSWYKDFYYYGKGAVISLQQAADRWTQVEDGTIGKGLFPDCQLYASVLETSGWEQVLIKDGVLDTNDPAPEIYAVIPKDDGSFSAPDKLVFEGMTDTNPDFLDFNEQFTANLEEGENRLGIHSLIRSEVETNSGTYNKDTYIDFKWLTINYTPMPEYQLLGCNPKDYIEPHEYRPEPYTYNATITAPNMENISDDIMGSFETLSFNVQVAKLPFNITIRQNVSDIWDTYTYSTPNQDVHTLTQGRETYKMSVTQSDGQTKETFIDDSGNFTISVGPENLKYISDGYYMLDAMFTLDYSYNAHTLVSFDGSEFEHSADEKGIWLLMLQVYVTVL